MASLQSQTEMLFYDGDCGLCHRTVKFVLRHDRKGARGRAGYAFRFAPLQGATFAAMVPAGVRAELPDSLVVRTSDGALLARSAAVIHIGRRLGGAWAGMARVAELVPRVVRDAAYDFVARVRHKLFARPQSACPVPPEEWRDRFEP
ncbi:MAG: DCC1-like thiol-disulfide oxidoreductase family protein [Candidatus Acidiferrales bacterium]